MATIETKFGCMSEVWIPANNYQKGRIVEIAIKRYNIMYLVEYFLSGEVKICWLYDDEITNTPPKENQVGLK